MITITELLQLRGLNTTAKIKLVRHQDKRVDLYELMITGQLENYQRFQSKPVFNCEYIISFFGLPYEKARLLGVYEVKGKTTVAEIELPPGYPLEESPETNAYELMKVPGFEDLEERVVIDWGKSTRSWHQWLKGKEKPVVEILPEGFTRPFPGYLDVLVRYEELCRIINYGTANRDWYASLKAVAGVYLIVDLGTGQQYVGSAYGANGIWGRWKTYVENGHGDNKQLVELLQKDPKSTNRFQFSILRTLSRSLTAAEVIECENFYKRMLGTRAFGLNCN